MNSCLKLRCVAGPDCRLSPRPALSWVLNCQTVPHDQNLVACLGVFESPDNLIECDRLQLSWLLGHWVGAGMRSSRTSMTLVDQLTYNMYSRVHYPGGIYTLSFH